MSIALITPRFVGTAQNAEPISCCKQAEHYFKTVADHTNQPTISLMLLLASNVNKAVAQIFESAKANCAVVADLMEYITGGLGTLSLLYLIKMWVYDSAASLQQLISRVCSTVGKVLSHMLFFAKLGLYNLSRIAVYLGSIPVLNLVASSLTILSVSFSLWHTAKGYHSLKLEQKRLTACIENLDPKCDVKMKQYLANDKLLRKDRIAMITNVALLALGALAMASLCTGWGFLAATGAFMITAGTLSVLMGLYSSYSAYQVRHLKRSDLPDVVLQLEEETARNHHHGPHHDNGHPHGNHHI